MIDTSANIAERNSILNSCWRAVHHLPATFHMPSYGVLKTIKLTSTLKRFRFRGKQQSRGPRSVPLQMNIVQIVRRPDGCVYTSNAQLICENFDFTICSVALEIKADLSFSFQGFNGAFADLQSGRLVLGTRAFSCANSPVAMQMARIAKYVFRGYRW